MDDALVPERHRKARRGARQAGEDDAGEVGKLAGAGRDAGARFAQGRGRVGARIEHHHRIAFLRKA